jgi:hypothetical protein
MELGVGYFLVGICGIATSVKPAEGQQLEVIRDEFPVFGYPIGRLAADGQEFLAFVEQLFSGSYGDSVSKDVSGPRDDPINLRPILAVGQFNNAFNVM